MNNFQEASKIKVSPSGTDLRRGLLSGPEKTFLRISFFLMPKYTFTGDSVYD